MRVSTPARVSTFAYVNPVIALFLGWALGNEAPYPKRRRPLRITAPPDTFAHPVESRNNVQRVHCLLRSCWRSGVPDRPWQGGFGGLLGMVATPLMSLVMPVSEVVGLMLPMLILGDIFAVSAHWRRWDTHIFMRLIPGALVGVFIGTYVVATTSPSLLCRLLSVLILLFVAYMLTHKRLIRAVEYQSRGWHGVLAGSVAGTTSALAHAGDPPVAICLML